MKRRNRRQSIFTLSALDLLATAMGAFILLTMVLMPYYLNSMQARAEALEIEALASKARMGAKTQSETAAKTEAEAARAEALAKEAMLTALAAEASASSLQGEANAARNRAGSSLRMASQMKSIMDRRTIKELDLIFVVDSTASMMAVLEDMALSLSGISRILERLMPSVRIGIVAYRDDDIPGSWVVKSLPLLDAKARLDEILLFAAALRPAGPGPTVDEAVFKGLKQALGMDLRPQAKQSIIVIGDARAHPNEERQTLDLARQFAASGERRSVSATYVETDSSRLFGKGDRDFFMRLAKAGGGSFSEHGGQLTENVLLAILEE